MGLIVLAAILCQTDPQSLQGWIEKLASDRIDVRDEASKRLLDAGDDAIPLLKKAQDQGDLEFRARCRDILTRMHLEKTKVEPGARQLSGIGVDVPDMRPDPEKKKEFNELLAKGKIKEIVAKDYEWLTYAIDGILSDEKVEAEGSLRVVHEIIKKRGIPAVNTDLVSKPDMKLWHSAELRSAEYTYWAQWWFTKAARDFVEEWADNPSFERITDWVEALTQLHSGEGLKDPGSRQSRLMRKMRSMQKDAYPILIRFIDDDDAALGSTAVRLLQELSGRESKAPTAKNKAELRKDWQEWLDSNP